MKRPRASLPAAQSVILAAAALLAVFSSPPLVPQAWAQQPCKPRADALRILADKYAEAPVAIGLANNGALVEVLAAKDGTTWTILVTTPAGRSCMVSAGENWRALEPEPEGDKL